MSDNNSQPKNFNESTRVIQNCVDSLELPDSIREQAKQIYLHSYRENTYRGRCKDDIIAASVYAGIRITEDTSLSCEELANQFSDSCEESIFDTYLHLVQSLGLPIPPESVSGHIQDIAEDLDLSDETISVAQDIHTTCKENSQTYTSGKSVLGIAAASVYNAVETTDDDVTQTDLSDVAGITPVTIRNRYKEQQEILEEV